jgi:hypothetical protein
MVAASHSCVGRGDGDGRTAVAERRSGNLVAEMDAGRARVHDEEAAPLITIVR